jgi:hypothetical protein
MLFLLVLFSIAILLLPISSADASPQEDTKSWPPAHLNLDELKRSLAEVYGAGTVEHNLSAIKAFYTRGEHIPFEIASSKDGGSYKESGGKPLVLGQGPSGLASTSSRCQIDFVHTASYSPDPLFGFREERSTAEVTESTCPDSASYTVNGLIIDRGLAAFGNKYEDEDEASATSPSTVVASAFQEIDPRQLGGPENLVPTNASVLSRLESRGSIVVEGVEGGPVRYCSRFRAVTPGPWVGPGECPPGSF